MFRQYRELMQASFWMLILLLYINLTTSKGLLMPSWRLYHEETQSLSLQTEEASLRLLFWSMPRLSLGQPSRSPPRAGKFA